MLHVSLQKFTQLLKPRLSRRGLCASLLFTLATTAANSEVPNSALAPTDLNGIRQICSTTMRTRRGDADFDVCVSSLSDVLVQKVRAVQFQEYKKACQRKGLSTDTAAYDVCVADYENHPDEIHDNITASALPEPPSNVSDADSDRYPTNAGSPPRVRDRREKLSCAQLGLEPGSDAFVGCVNGLNTALFATDHPI